MDRTQKKEMVAYLGNLFSTTEMVIVTRNHGLTVAKTTALRNQMRTVGASHKVTKNRLARIALEGTRYAILRDYMVGPTAISTSDDPVSVAKVVVDFCKANKEMEVMGAAMGDTILDVPSLQKIAALPSLDELRGRIVGLIQAPATKVAQVITAPAGKLARVFDAYAGSDKTAA